MKWYKHANELGTINLKDGEPCYHPGCLSHVKHPCEICGRRAGIVTLPEECFEI